MTYMPPEEYAQITLLTLNEASLRDLTERISTASDGAVVTFTGVVRREDGGREVVGLAYEAHPSAQQILAEVVTEVTEETGCACAAIHRIGALTVGDIAVQCAVAAPHRHAAFVACERLIDELKARVPIWKRQQFVDGTDEWVGL